MTVVAEPGPIDAGLADALADELVLAAGRLADLAYDLGTDESVLRRHMGSLQAIDHVTQLQLEIAALLRRSRATCDPVADVVLEDMKLRLSVALAGTRGEGA